MTRLPLNNSRVQESAQGQNTILDILKSFWRFSLYYGKYVSTPLAQRENIKLP